MTVGARQAAIALALDEAIAVAGAPAAGLTATNGGVVERLADHLYVTWYAGPVAAAPDGPADDVTEALRAAHAGAGRFAAGWRAERVSSAGRVLATRSGRRRLLHPLDYLCPDRAGLPPRVGDALLAVARRDSPESQGGFWMALGRSWPDEGSPSELVRVYWNLPVEGAPELVRTLTGTLEPSTAPWALKLPTDARQHARADAAVLYLPRAAFAELAPRLRGVAAALREHLVNREPPLALRLSPGVALAEDPGGNESFGSHRCRLIAEALVGAVGTGDGLRDAIRARFAAAGLDPDRPHLQPGSTAAYPWAGPAAEPPPVERSSRTLPPPRPSSVPPPEDDRFLRGAAAICDRLVTEAIWHDDRCTWVGDALEPVGDGWSVVLRACDGDLYGGTAGVALFLARAATATGRPQAAATAVGAARHALRRGVAECPPGGLYEGVLGSLWAALDVARELEDRELAGRALSSAREVLARPPADPGEAWDLMAGAGGTLVAALGIERACSGPEPVADARVARLARLAAEVAGEALLAAARPTAAGWWWEAGGAQGPGGLCGLAHGGSGIALALAELGARTGDGRFAEAGRQAVSWERRWFSRSGGGWPDLRAETVHDGGSAYPALWCHGAAGIGLARLASWDAGGDPVNLAEAGAAIQAARAAAGAWPADALDWSLCHGLGGVIELMLCAWQALGHPDHLTAARRLGARALADAGGGARPWRCGVPEGGGETPGLLLGLAGIGTVLLRLHDPALAPTPVLCAIPFPVEPVSAST